MATILFVHPGYLRRTDIDPFYLDPVRNNPSYGSYQEYLTHIQRLHAQATHGVFIVEMQGERLHPYHMTDLNRRKEA